MANITMEIPVYTVDAFTRAPFKGNPAAVCVVSRQMKLSEDDMQSIALEMNLSETAFIQETDDQHADTGSRFGLRWFTPTNEVNLCGHATLASAAVLFQCYDNQNAKLEFETLSGVLSAEISESGFINLNLPLGKITEQLPESTYPILEAINPRFPKLTVVYSPNTKKLLARLPDTWTREDLESIPIPNTDELLSIHDGSEIKGVIISVKSGGCDSEGKSYDFISRYFAAWNGIPEDPVTGSAHTVLGKYWAAELDKNDLYARQCSKRGGDVKLSLDEPNDRIYVGGKASIVLSGKLHLPVME